MNIAWKTRGRGSNLTCALLMMVLGSCGTYSANTTPTPPVEIPEDDGREFSIPYQGQWWLGLQDPELTQLIDIALQENLQLKQSWARVRQAGALHKTARSSLWPTISAQIEAGRSRTAINIPGQEATATSTNSYRISVPMQYEIDIWGKARAGQLAASQDVLAAQADYEAAAVTIAATVTERWFDVLEQRALRLLLAEQQQNTSDFLELIERQYERNETGLSDVLQQDIQLRSLKLQQARSIRDEKIADRQLALLLGRVPQSVVGSDRSEFPAPLAMPEEGIPIRYIRNRPDVQAAERRVVAADHRIGQAIAAKFPNLSLSGSMGFSASTITSLFDTFVWNILGSVGGAIFDGGRNAAEVQRSRATRDIALYGYGQTLIDAMLELESAVIRQHHQVEEISILELQVLTSERALQAAQLRYQQGLTGYLSVLTALQSVQQSQQSLLSAKRRLLSLRVQVYRALGSGWTANLPEYQSKETNEKG